MKYKIKKFKVFTIVFCILTFILCFSASAAASDQWHIAYEDENIIIYDETDLIIEDFDYIGIAENGIYNNEFGTDEFDYYYFVYSSYYLNYYEFNTNVNVIQCEGSYGFAQNLTFGAKTVIFNAEFQVDENENLIYPYSDEQLLSYYSELNQVINSSISGSGVISNITSGFSSFISGIGNLIVSTFDTIFTNGAGGLSNIAIWGLVFGGVAFATAIIKYFVNKAK